MSTTLTKEQIVSARELVAVGAVSLCGNFALQICDLALKSLSVPKEEDLKKPENPNQSDTEQFWERYKKDNGSTMSKDQWTTWVNALPENELLAMLNMGN